MIFSEKVTTLLSLSTHFSLESVTSQLFFVCYLISVMMFFLQCMMNTLRQIKFWDRLLQKWYINTSLKSPDILGWKQQWCVDFSFSGENCISFPCFLFITKSCSLDASSKTIFLITLICSTVWGEVNGTSSLTKILRCCNAFW